MTERKQQVRSGLMRVLIAATIVTCLCLVWYISVRTAAPTPGEPVRLSTEQQKISDAVHVDADAARRQLEPELQRFGLAFEQSSPQCWRFTSESDRADCSETIRTNDISMGVEMVREFSANAHELTKSARGLGWEPYVQNERYDWSRHQDDTAAWLASNMIEIRFKKVVGGSNCAFSMTAGQLTVDKLNGYISCSQPVDADGLRSYPG